MNSTPTANSPCDLLNHGSAGKGDKNRVSNIKAFRTNYDEIDWSNGSIDVITKKAEVSAFGVEEFHWNKQPDGTWRCQETGEVVQEMKPPFGSIKITHIDGVPLSKAPTNPFVPPEFAERYPIKY